MNKQLTKLEVYKKAVKFFENGEYEQAEDLYNKILEKDPSYASALHGKGVLLRARNEFQNSLKYIKKALEINPNHLQFWLTLSDTYYRLNEFELALEVIEKAKLFGHKDNKIDTIFNLINDKLNEYPLKELNFKIPNEKNLKVEEAFKIANDSYEKNHYKTIAYADFVLKKDPNNLMMIKAKTNTLAFLKQYDLAIKILSNFIDRGFGDSEIINNLGSCYQQMGNYKKAIEQFKISIEMVENSNVRDNLGVSLIEIGNIKEGINEIKNATNSQPSNIMFRQHLIEAYIRDKNFLEAMQECKTTLKYDINNKTILSYYRNLFSINKTNVKKIYDAFDEKICNFLLEEDPNFTSVPFELLLDKIPNELKKFEKRNKEKVEEKIYSSKKVIQFLNDKTLLLLLKKSFCSNDRLEKILTMVRYDFLNIALKGYSNHLNFEDFNDFIRSVSIQCYNNEYLWNISEKEFLQIEELNKKFNENDDNKFFNLYLLSSYSYLNKRKLNGLSLINDNQVKEIINIHFQESEKIEILKNEIKSFDEIKNLSSIKVRDQYEENPYPRWKEVIKHKKITIEEYVNLEIMPNKGSYSIENPEILIAGCGTGRELVVLAKYFKKAKFFAIDLSLNSLAYAKMKCEENNVDNIDFLQCDILSLKKLNKKFDIIFSTGVIHHMENPDKGLDILCSCLNKNGLMRLGLYSEIARKNIINIKNEIKNIYPKSITDKSIREVRDFIFSSDSKSSIEIKKMNDFYSMSSFRDLIMHAQEKNYSINDIKLLLKNFDLTFIGFSDPKVKIIYKEEFPDDRSMLNLDNWGKFEEINNSAFISMYQFWVTK